MQRPPDSNRHQAEQAGAPGGQPGSVGQRAWQGLAQPLLGGEVNQRNGRSWRVGRREAVRAVGGAGTSWERQPGQRSFGLDTRGPWAWAALPKRRGLGGPALERGCSRLEREEAPAAHPPSPAPCSQQWPAQTRSPSLASTCVPTDTSSRTRGLIHTHTRPASPTSAHHCTCAGAPAHPGGHRSARSVCRHTPGPPSRGCL